MMQPSRDSLDGSTTTVALALHRITLVLGFGLGALSLTLSGVEVSTDVLAGLSVAVMIAPLLLPRIQSRVIGADHDAVEVEEVEA